MMNYKKKIMKMKKKVKTLFILKKKKIQNKKNIYLMNNTLNY